MSRNAHTCQDLLEVLLGDLRDIDRLKVVQNEMLIRFLGSSSVSCFNTILNKWKTNMLPFDCIAASYFLKESFNLLDF